MRFSRVEIHSAGRLKATLNLSELRHQSPYIIKAMSGLDVTEVLPRFYGFSDTVGEDGRRVPYFEPVLPPREIAVRVGFRPNHKNYGNNSSLRDELYRILGSSRTNRVQLQFHNGAQHAMWISAESPKVEPSLFSSEAEAVLTFQCKDPLFRGPNLMTAHPADIRSSVFSGSRVVKFSDVQSTYQHGASFTVKLQDPATKFQFLTVQDDNTSLFELDVSGGFFHGGNWTTQFADESFLTVDTSNLLPQIVYMSPNLIETNLVSHVSINSVWPRIFCGENEFRLVSYNGINITAPPTLELVSWLPHYAGV